MPLVGFEPTVSDLESDALDHLATGTEVYSSEVEAGILKISALANFHAR